MYSLTLIPLSFWPIFEPISTPSCIKFDFSCWGRKIERERERKRKIERQRETGRERERDITYPCIFWLPSSPFSWCHCFRCFFTILSFCWATLRVVFSPVPIFWITSFLDRESYEFWLSVKFFEERKSFWSCFSTFGPPVPFPLQYPHFRVFRSVLRASIPTWPLLSDPTSSVLKSYVQYRSYSFSTTDFSGSFFGSISSH